MMVENNSTNRRILKLYTKRVLNKFYNRFREIRLNYRLSYYRLVYKC